MDEQTTNDATPQAADAAPNAASRRPQQEVTNQPDRERRALLAGVFLTALTSLIPSARSASPAPADQDAFLAASEFLTGRPSLEPGQASRLYEALIADDPQLPERLAALLDLIKQQRIDPLNLQQLLDQKNAPLAALPRKIVTAWYTGAVGEGDNARCVAFETSLMNVVVSDKLKPPSYCHGGYGSWVEKP
jgi:fructose 5-dehydrogenase small subunit